MVILVRAGMAKAGVAADVVVQGSVLRSVVVGVAGIIRWRTLHFDHGIVIHDLFLYCRGIGICQGHC